MKYLLPLLLVSSLGAISTEELQTIGKRIELNECGTDRRNLTFWNIKEGFPSLGIGHFTWMPDRKKARFEETFPSLVVFLKNHDVEVPKWMEGECPWQDRKAFYADKDSVEMKELYALLSETRHLQSLFMLERLEAALPQLLEGVDLKEHERLTRRFHTLAETPEGLFALVDYTNFKGYGTSAKERYNGEGWGLLQALQAMRDDDTPIHAFKEACTEVLSERVRNAPPERAEFQWLGSWLNRINQYGN